MADRSSGRGVATSHHTVAAALGMSAKTVQRARALLETLGLAVTVAEGRYLYKAEREAARAAHGGHQLRAASLRALTMPARRSVENVQLPRRGETTHLTHLLDNSTKRASAQRTTATRPPAEIRTTKTPRPQKRVADRKPVPLPVQIFAAKLTVELPALARHGHIGAVSKMLSSVGVDMARWTVADLVSLIHRRLEQLGKSVFDLAGMRSPVGFISWLIREDLNSDEMIPSEVREAIAAERAERVEQQRLEREREAARAAQIDRDAVARIIAASHAEIAARQRQKRYRLDPSTGVES